STGVHLTPSRLSACRQRRTQNLSRQDPPHHDSADGYGLAIARRLRAPCEIRAVANRHDRQGLGRRQHRPMSGARMVRMTMRDHGPVHRPHRIDIEISRRAIKACGRRPQKILRTHHRFTVWLDKTTSGRRPKATLTKDALMTESFLTALLPQLASGAAHTHALGFAYEGLEGDRVRMRVPYRHDLVGDPETGVLAGGLVTTLLDHAGGLAVWVALDAF